MKNYLNKTILTTILFVIIMNVINFYNNIELSYLYNTYNNIYTNINIEFIHDFYNNIKNEITNISDINTNINYNDITLSKKITFFILIGILLSIMLERHGIPISDTFSTTSSELSIDCSNIEESRNFIRQLANEETINAVEEINELSKTYGNTIEEILENIMNELKEQKCQ